MSDSDTPLVENDLDAFSEEFFQKTNHAKREPEVKAEEPVEDEALDDEDLEAEESEIEEETPEDEESEAEDEEEDDDPEPEPKHKNRKSAKERIQELNTKLRETERQAATERAENSRRLAELEQKLAPKIDPKPASAPTGPRHDDKNEDGSDKYALGEFDPQYIRDFAVHTIKQENLIAEGYRKEAEQARAVAAAREEANVKYVEKIEAVKEDIPDIVEKIESLSNMFSSVDQNYGQYLVDVVKTLDNAPRVLAYLADNPKAARDLVNSGPASATIGLGRLDARMAKKTKEEDAPKKVSRAPEPPKKTVRGTQGRFAVKADTDDLDAFEKTFFSRK